MRTTPQQLICKKSNQSVALQIRKKWAVTPSLSERGELAEMLCGLRGSGLVFYET